MKKILLSGLILFNLASCSQEKPEEDKMKNFIEANKADVDLSLGNIPKEFSAKTVDGKTFNSKDFKGKHWVLFAYYKNYLQKENGYDMVAELNETYKRFGDKVPMIGLITGSLENNSDVPRLIKAAQFDFPQIDNTDDFVKQPQIKENIYCGPAKILFDPQGKIIHMTCGGKSNSLDYQIDSLIRANKL